MICAVSGVLKASRKVEVHFVDFGNRELVECEELRDMPETILNDLPVQAVACSLYGVEQAGSVSMWSPADVDSFSDMVCDQLLEVCFMSAQNTNGHYLVHLLKDQENINRTFLRRINKLSPSYSSPSDMRAAGDASASVSVKSADSRGTENNNTVVTSKEFKYEACMAGEELVCVASYVVSPGQFYVHKNSETSRLESMMEQLNADSEKSATSVRTLNWSVGQPCRAMFAEDGRWYRAKILSMSAQHLTVDFVDYGNSDTVDRNAVMPLQSQYFSAPVHAVHCRLAGVVPVGGSDWSDDAAACFEELLGEATHAMKIVSVSEFTHTAELTSVALKLIDRGFARHKADPTAAALSSGRPSRAVDTRQTETQVKKRSSRDFEPAVPSAGGSFSSPVSAGDSSVFDTLSPGLSSSALLSYTALDVAVGSQQSVVVSWVVTPSEFYCQLTNNCSVIEKLSSDVRKTYQSARDLTMSAADCVAGRTCVAFYEPDQSWYRSRIISCESDRVKVFYVDYGNTEVLRVGQIRQATAQFTTSPAVQAVKCCVSDKLSSDWTRQEITAFDRAVTAPRLNCKFIDKRDDGYMVELLDQSGRNVTSELRAESTTGAVAGKETVTSRVPVKTYVYECGLKVGDVAQLEVVHVADGSSVFSCHMVGQTDDLDKLMTELADDCERRPALSSFPGVGQPCAALYSDDGGWYRATVDSIAPDDANHRVVKFVDYGNVESCAVSSLRELDARFLRVPVRRVDCRLRRMTAASLDEVVDDLLAQQFTATVVSIDGSNVLTVDLKTAESGESFEVTHPELFTPPSVSLPITSPPENDVDVYVTHVISPSDFYIQPSSFESRLTDLAEQLTQCYDGDTGQELTMLDFTVGSVCCARYSADGSWYRAMIDSVMDDTVSVTFVDYGNSDAVSRSDVRQLTERFASIPACAWHCRLAVGPDSATCWTDTQQQSFADLTAAGEKLLACSFVSRSESPYPVILRDGEVNIGQELYCTVDVAVTEDDAAIVLSDLPVPDCPSDATEVCITSALSPSDFYVQLTSVDDELSQLADNLMNYYECIAGSECQLMSVDIGSVCCARYSADSAWYRALVTDVVSTDEVRVLFIDYGNTDIVSRSADVRPLRAKFRTKAPYVYHCALAGLSDRTSEDWSDEVKTRFIELTATEEEVPAVFTCEFVGCDSDSECHLVSLVSADGVDVCSMFADMSAVTDAVDVDRVTSLELGEETYRPADISASKYQVSHSSLSLSIVIIIIIIIICTFLSRRKDVTSEAAPVTV